MVCLFITRRAGPHRPGIGEAKAAAWLSDPQLLEAEYRAELRRTAYHEAGLDVLFGVKGHRHI
jgi:hypothetical protein